MIHTSRTVTVGKTESIINEPIALYRGDREVEVEFAIVGSKFTFSKGGNVIKSTNATHGQLVVDTPTGENMFSEVTECHEGKVVFTITKEMIDELAEVGLYSFQIRLFDESQVSRVTIPPVYQGIEIRNPIAAEDETDLVDIGLVDFSVVRKDNYENVVTFLPNGDYNKTLWEEHDVISKNRLNKVEDALYEINKGTESLYPTLQNQYDEFSAKVNKDVKAYKEEMEDEVEQFETDMTQAFGEFKVDYKDEVHERLDNIAIDVSIYKCSDDLSNIINNIILKNNQSHLELFFPKGDYILNDLNVSGNITFKSNGDANIYTEKLFETISDRSCDINIINMNMFSINESGNYMMSIQNPSRIKIHNCTFELKQPFLQLSTTDFYDTSFRHDISIRNNHIKGVIGTKQSFCINVVNAVHSGWIDSNIFEDLKVSSCIRLFETEADENRIIGCSDWKITNNTFYNIIDVDENQSATGLDCAGIYVRGNYIKISNNTFDQIQGNHIDIQTTENLIDTNQITKKSSYSVISNNNFIRDISNGVFSGEALLHCRTSDVIISDNVFVNRTNNDDSVPCVVCKWGRLSKVVNNIFSTKTSRPCIVLYSAMVKNTPQETGLISNNQFTNEGNISSIELQVANADFGDVIISNNFTNTTLLSFKKFTDNEFKNIIVFNNIASGKMFDFTTCTPSKIKTDELGDHNFYVTTNGNDLNFGTTSSKPAKTIQKIINMLPKNGSAYNVTINVSSGDYSGDSIYIENFDCKSTINITCEDDVILDRIYVTNCTGLKVIVTKGILTNSTGDSVRNTGGNSTVTINQSKISGKYGILNESIVYCNNVTFDCATYCARSQRFSKIMLTDCTFDAKSICKITEGSLLIRNNSPINSGQDVIESGGIVR